MIPENKTRIALTLPKDAANAFRQDAKELNLSFSTYVYLCLAGMSMHMEEVESSAMLDRLNRLISAAVGDPLGSED